MKKFAMACTVLVAVTVAFAARRRERENRLRGINKIKQQGLNAQNSQVMEIMSYLTDVYGPRLTGSPNVKKAGDWAVGQDEGMGPDERRARAVDRTGNGFERGWENEKFYLAAVSPQAFPIPGTPTGWTPGTNGLVRGDVVAGHRDDRRKISQKYAGKLKGKWILGRPAPDVAAYWTAPAQPRNRRKSSSAMELAANRRRRSSA